MKRRTLVSIFAALIPLRPCSALSKCSNVSTPQNGFFYSASSGDSFLTLLLSKDSATGKEVWLSAGDVMYISMAFVAVAALLAFVFSFLAKDRKTLYLPPKNGLLLGIFSVLTGIGLLPTLQLKSRATCWIISPSTARPRTRRLFIFSPCSARLRRFALLFRE